MTNTGLKLCCFCFSFIVAFAFLNATSARNYTKETKPAIPKKIAANIPKIMESVKKVEEKINPKQTTPKSKAIKNPKSIHKIEEEYEGKCSHFKINKKAAINPNAKHYVAMRWDYNKLAKTWGIEKKEVKGKLKNCWVLIKNPKNSKEMWCQVGDWGPHQSTDRLIDTDPKVLKYLGCDTDDIVKVALFERKP